MSKKVSVEYRRITTNDLIVSNRLIRLGLRGVMPSVYTSAFE
jgi:hypothetical protein